MANEEQYQYVANTLDVAWIIALWHWIHGENLSREKINAQNTELIGRAFVGLLFENEMKVPKDTIEKLGQLGIKLTLREGDRHQEIKSTEEFYERMTATESEGSPIPCMSIRNGHPVCWSPIWDLYPGISFRR